MERIKFVPFLVELFHKSISHEPTVLPTELNWRRCHARMHNNLTDEALPAVNFRILAASRAVPF